MDLSKETTMCPKPPSSPPHPCPTSPSTIASSTYPQSQKYPSSNPSALMLIRLPAVARVLKDYGCSCMATFLDAQLSKEYRNGTNFTIFAPLDVAFPEAVKRNISDYSSIFRKHVVPRLLTWRDLISLPDNTLLPTLFSNDFSIRVTISWMVRYVNGVLVVVPDMHRSDFVVVHGIRRLLDNTIV
ncbi:putative fasciclin-like arabinogalactan protein 20 [Arachis duranensis]|uniref:Fasciclin-like arabinogalactan protein 20 n=1 Tax=Arachis duranensis TaxID=130453 RepID=A0A6P4DRT7_ARADU|nr:putative fasciclin-like arabinogalactan protein 20 [Arachis duranensis]